LLVNLEADEPWAPPKGLGQQGVLAHAMLLELVRHLDPVLAERLHGSDFDRAKPFTVSPFLGEGGEVAAGPQAPQRRWGLRLTWLADAVAARMEAALAGPGLAARVGAQPVRVSLRPPAEEGAVVRAGFEELRDPLPGRPATRVRMRFVTPTTFRSGKRNLLFPTPSLVFHGLREKWDEHAGLPLPSFPAAAFDAAVNVARYELRTALLEFGRYRQVGFWGTCEYLPLPGADPAVWAAAQALARFAPFAGVGYKTTMGMGQVRLV
jgi:CRISPR-associated endoribonuclease Cas6